mmetsp:Transcript_4238/g.6891  ORF Transcript_4238/g.6891 Transcript_4238/m.6891 type:complete len:482 (+) Transcript_4238:72-1517(+)
MFSSSHVFATVAFLVTSSICVGILWRFSAPRVPSFDTPPREAHEPYLVQLRRESVPVKRKGEVVSHKTSYSGVLSVGVGDQVPQEFRVVFDTGSGHVVFPSAGCKSESCRMHRRYDVSQSPSATPINADGSTVPPDELCDQVKIGFGTGSVVGEFVRDTVCLGSASAGGAQWRDSICQEVQIVTAVEMSTIPFKNFGFDGILGLGLKSLALSPDFSFFNLLSNGNKLGAPHFGVFLTDDNSGETSEIAIGGHNPARLLQPLAWSPVAKPELGYWQVEITAVRVNGVELDFCRDGSCRGVMDTGTSHLGIPAPHDKSLAELLTADAADLSDCREVHAPVLEIEVPGFNITLDPENYMRRLPLRAGINVGSSKGVVLPSQAESTTTLPPTVLRDDGSEVERYCRPRLMPVNLPAPVGPHLFILGEPVLQRYYTVFDWKGPSIGFGLSTNAKKGKKAGIEDDGVMFFQVTITVRRSNTRLFALA